MTPAGGLRYSDSPAPKFQITGCYKIPKSTLEIWRSVFIVRQLLSWTSPLMLIGRSSQRGGLRSQTDTETAHERVDPLEVDLVAARRRGQQARTRSRGNMAQLAG